MPDREKVLKGLECHAGLCSKDCPYFEISDYCDNELCNDALALLKEQADEIEKLHTQLDEAMLWR